MSETPVYLLLITALIVPVAGALLLRLVMAHISERTFNLAAAVVFGVAMLSALILSRADIPLLRLGDVTLLLPGTRFTDDSNGVTGEVPAEPTGSLLPTQPATEQPVIDGIVQPTMTGQPTRFVPPTLTPRPTLTVTPQVTATAEPTPQPTATAEQTALPTETPTAVAASQTYTVQEGDFLRLIADRFGVSVEDLLAANGLTPDQADSLRVGQELVIP